MRNGPDGLFWEIHLALRGARPRLCRASARGVLLSVRAMHSPAFLSTPCIGFNADFLATGDGEFGHAAD
jgi:hypothetical protein